MKKIKKYEWGTFSASGATPQMVNPENAYLKQRKMDSAQTAGMPMATPSTADPNAKSLSNIKLPAAGPKGPSFMDKAGAFMGDYGGIIGSVGTSIASLINANKKQDPTGKPYKKGSKLIKYQEGTDNLENKTRFQNFMSGDIRRTSTGNLIGTLPTSYNEAKVPSAETMPEGRKPIISLQNYKENRGGYARALKSGVTDKSGNLVDPQTGYIYKKLNAVKSSSSTISRKNVPTTRVEKSTTPVITPTPSGTMTGDELVLMSKMGKDFNPYSAIGSNVPFSKPAVKAPQKPTPKGIMTGKEMVLMSKQGKAFNPYTMAGFPNPIPRTEVKAPIQKKETTKVDNRRVYPEESPLAKYRKGIPSKPSTNVPTRVMDYRKNLLTSSQREELTNNMKAYGMVSPFNPNGSVNFYTPFFEMGHNARFGKKK